MFAFRELSPQQLIQASILKVRQTSFAFLPNFGDDDNGVGETHAHARAKFLRRRDPRGAPPLLAVRDKKNMKACRK